MVQNISNYTFIVGLIIGQTNKGWPVIKLWSKVSDIKRTQRWGAGFVIWGKKVVPTLEVAQEV